jgi:hypothetical protein
MRSSTNSVTSILCLVFVGFILGAAGSRGRECARQVMCSANLSRLTLAWLQYAHDNDRHIINGMAGTHRKRYGWSIDENDNVSFPSFPDIAERAWVGADWGDFLNLCTPAPPEKQLAALRTGSFWPYCQETMLYHCPSRLEGHLRSYDIVDSMNGQPRAGTSHGMNISVRVGKTTLLIQNLDEIDSPGPDRRMVFIDAGRATPDSYAVHYIEEAWWEPTPLGHDHGTYASFADGHTELWHWQDPRTIEAGKLELEGRFWTDAIRGQPHNPDLRRLQKAVWGRLGYAE